MGPLAAAGDTWGISGPTFLWIYAGAGLLAVALSLLLRRRGRVRGRAAIRELEPYEAAFLAGGRRRAVVAALAVLRADGVIDRAKGTTGVLRPAAGSPLRSVSTPLDDAVYAAIRQGGRPKVGELADDPQVRARLDGLETALEREGLLFSGAERTQVRMASLPVWLVLAAGVARLVAGLANGKPVGFLVLMMAVLAAAGGLLLIVPKKTDAGARALRWTEQRHAHLAPALAPAWETYGALGVGLGVALYGVDALAVIDPEFARWAGLSRYLDPSAGAGGTNGSLGTAGGGGAGAGGCGGGGDGGGDGGGGGGGGGGGCGG